MSIGSKLRELGDGFSDIFFPIGLKCDLCGKEKPDGAPLCDECLQMLDFAGQDVCLRCGRAVVGEEQYCDICSNGDMKFDDGISVFAYSGAGKELVLKFKNGAKYLGKYLACLMYDRFRASGVKVDAISYVPAAEWKERERGYDQAAVLAEELSKLTGLPVLDAVYKYRISDQKQFAIQSRQARVPEYKPKAIDLDGKNLLLVDDIITTGNTLSSVAAALKSIGSGRITVITLAYVLRKSI